MPTPIGHALGSLVAGAPQRRGWLLLALVGVAPDLDLLWGRHSMETHSLGAAVIAGFVLAAAQGVRTKQSVRTSQGVRAWLRAFAIFAAVWFAHPVMDALGDDSSVPRGVMLWWPFSREFYIAPFTVFDSAYRAYWKPDFWPHNIVAVAKEIAILGPLTAIAWVWRRRSART
jgi:hypothetical protein